MSNDVDDFLGVGPVPPASVAPTVGGQDFSALGGAAGFVTVVGWIVVLIGVVLVIGGFAASHGANYTLVGGGFGSAFSGLFLVLVGGAVKVLIAIEGHLRNKA